MIVYDKAELSESWTDEAQKTRNTSVMSCDTSVSFDPTIAQ